MLRIAHRIAALRSDDEAMQTNQKLLASGQMHVVVCDNVSAYSNAHRDKTARQLAGCVPPWAMTHYEWIHPEGLGPYAMLVRSVNRHAVYGDDDLELKAVSENCSEAAAEAMQRTEWILYYCIHMVHRGMLIPFVTRGLIALDADGTLCASAAYESQFPQDSTRTIYHHCAYTVLLANSMMNCKNVRTIDSTDQDAPPAKWQRRMKTPAIRYSRIAIEPFTAEVARQGGVEGGGIAKAWHICRGHFATYTDDKPLFGKYAGRFWIPQHAKGDKKLGTVISTHEVKAPQ